MKNLLRVLLPVVSLGMILALTASLMASAYTTGAFKVTADDDPLLEGIRFTGEYLDYADKTAFDFALGAGETVKAVPRNAEKTAKLFDSFYPETAYVPYLRTADGTVTDYRLKFEITLPDGARTERLPQNDLVSNESGFSGVEILCDECWRTERMDCRILVYDTSVFPYQTIALGGPIRLTEQENGELFVYYEPKMVTKDGVTYNYDEIAYAKVGSRNAREVFSELNCTVLTDPSGEVTGFACLYSTDGNRTFAAWRTSVRDGEAVGTEELGTYRFDSPRELMAFALEGDTLLLATGADGEIRCQTGSDGVLSEPYRLPLSDRKFYQSEVCVRTTNGAAVFRSRCLYGASYEEHADYCALSIADGSLLAFGSADVPNYHHRALTVPEHDRNSFDALWKDGKLYILDNAWYDLSVMRTDIGAQGIEAPDELFRQGGGLFSAMLSVSVMDKNGEIAMDLHPLHANFSAGQATARQFVRVSFEKEKDR